MRCTRRPWPKLCGPRASRRSPWWRGRGGRSDADVLAAAEDRYALLTQNVADFARLAAERLTAGEHDAGVLIALSSRFTLRPTAIRRMPAVIRALVEEERLTVEPGSSMSGSKAKPAHIAPAAATWP